MQLSLRSHTLLMGPILVVAALVAISSGSLMAQSAETDLIPNLENEGDTGFEQSDLGNVAQKARVEYAEGNRSLGQARKLRKRIAETEDQEKRAKLETKLEETYQGAVQSFNDAIGYAPKMVEAYAGLGETLREWGKLEQSLEVHAAAVRRFPDDLENFEGWATTLMELNMLGNAVNAYSNYVESNPDRAAILMEVMKDWLHQKQADPGELSASDVQRLADWIQQQEAS